MMPPDTFTVNGNRQLTALSRGPESHFPLESGGPRLTLSYNNPAQRWHFWVEARWAALGRSRNGNKLPIFSLGEMRLGIGMDVGGAALLDCSAV